MCFVIWSNPYNMFDQIPLRHAQLHCQWHMLCGWLDCFSQIHFLSAPCSTLDYGDWTLLITPLTSVNSIFYPALVIVRQPWEIDRRKAEVRILLPLNALGSFFSCGCVSFMVPAPVGKLPLLFQSCQNLGSQTLVPPFSFPRSLQPWKQRLLTVVHLLLLFIYKLPHCLLLIFTLCHHFFHWLLLYFFYF